jgi:3-oxoacyl-[acyl-carrier protein] reductase
MELGLRGRCVIITGGSRGIGAACAEVFAAEGAQVAIIGRDLDALAAVAARTGAHPIAADLATAAGVRDALAACVDALGRVDVLVNNAGASATGTIEDITDEQWHETLDLKLLGYVRAMRAVIPVMRAQQHGRIVNIGGTAGVRATPGYVLASINAALVHITRSTAEHVAKDGINVVMVHPGPTLTDRLRSLMTAGAATAGVDVETFADQVAGRAVPLGRVGQPLEIARIVAVLASDLGAWVTGGGLTIDGGAATGIVGA